MNSIDKRNENTTILDEWKISRNLLYSFLLAASIFCVLVGLFSNKPPEVCYAFLGGGIGFFITFCYAAYDIDISPKLKRGEKS